MDITIKKEDHNLFIVKINSKNNSIHRVILKDDLHNHLTKGKISKEELIKLSFQFYYKENLTHQFYHLSN